MLSSLVVQVVQVDGQVAWPDLGSIPRILSSIAPILMLSSPVVQVGRVDGRVAWPDLGSIPGILSSIAPIMMLSSPVVQVVRVGGRVAWPDLTANPGILASVAPLRLLALKQANPEVSQSLQKTSYVCTENVLRKRTRRSFNTSVNSIPRTFHLGKDCGENRLFTVASDHFLVLVIQGGGGEGL
jgi:hypothetical protein